MLFRSSRTASPLVGRETVNATLWMQRAAEYRIATTQAFGLATDRLASTVAAPGTAALVGLAGLITRRRRLT